MSNFLNLVRNSYPEKGKRRKFGFSVVGALVMIVAKGTFAVPKSWNERKVR